MMTDELVELTPDIGYAALLLAYSGQRIPARYIGTESAHRDVEIVGSGSNFWRQDAWTRCVETGQFSNCRIPFTALRITPETAAALAETADKLNNHSYGADGTRDLSGRFRSAIRREQRS